MLIYFLFAGAVGLSALLQPVQTDPPRAGHDQQAAGPHDRVFDPLCARVHGHGGPAEAAEKGEEPEEGGHPDGRLFGAELRVQNVAQPRLR